LPENTNTTIHLLPPSDDGVFKALMTRSASADAPEAREVLKDLIGSILGCKIVQITLVASELPIDVKNDKLERFDVLCRTDKGKLINVEMQARPMGGDSSNNFFISIKTRSVYYVCDLHSSQPTKGIPYELIPKTYQIMICGFSIFGAESKLVDKYTFRNEEGRELGQSAD